MRVSLCLLALTVGLTACADGVDPGTGPLGLSEPDVRLDARVGGGSGRSCRPGRYDLRLEQGREALLLVTPPARTKRRGLLLTLHGAGSGGGGGGLWVFRRAWNVPGLVFVAPSAAGSAWTLERKDIGFVDRTLKRAFARCAVDPKRVAVGGFSSGAGLALWLGLANGNLFRRVISLAPGASPPAERVGKPKLFVAHGTKDDVIPIEAGGDRIVPALRRDGYEVTYRRFRGGHRVPPEEARRAVQWAVGR